MVRATRVTNPLSRALGAGIGIGALAAALFLMTQTNAASETPDASVMPVAAKVVPAS